MKLVFVFLLYVLFLLVNYVTRRMLGNLKQRGGFFSIAYRYFAVVELLFWTVLISWTFHLFFLNSSRYAFFYLFLLLVIMVGFLRFFVWDYVHGVLIKIRYQPEVGEQFESHQVSGTVVRVGLLLLEIKTNEGAGMKIPYSQIIQKSILSNVRKEGGREQVIQVHFFKTKYSDAAMVKLREIVLNSPWCYHRKPPTFTAAEGAHGEHSVILRSTNLNDDSQEKLAQLIKKSMRGLVEEVLVK